MSDSKFRYPIWSRGDLDGFFGLMVDNLVQVLLIIELCTFVCGLPNSLVYGRVLPGIAMSLLVGNLFYGLQAHYVARRDRNATCTALPFGISTPSVFAFALFVMAPVYEQFKGRLSSEAAGELAWKAGLLACLVAGLIEFFGAFVAERIRRVTPRAAMLGALAGIGIAFIASDFAFRIFSKPLISVVPLGILLLGYFGKFRFPFGLPGGFLAVALGAILAWVLAVVPIHPALQAWIGQTVALSHDKLREAVHSANWIAPTFVGHDLWMVLTNQDLVIRFLTISIPMGLINMLGSLQNIESAEAGGDRFAATPSLAVNGLGTIVAALFGSCFPTTIYIGHPGWKAMGARSGYSILNGLFFTLCFLFGGGAILQQLIPIEAGAAIVLYIGVVITAQAFQATPREHAPAIALAIFPALAALLVINLPQLMVDSNATRGLGEMLQRVVDGVPGIRVGTLPGMVALTGANSSWFVFSLLLAGIVTALIDRKYRAAGWWCLAASGLTWLGLLHAYRIEANDIRELFIWQAASGADRFVYRAFPIAISYAVMAAIFFVAGRQPAPMEPANDSLPDMTNQPV